MQPRQPSDSALFRAEVYFDENTNQIVISRSDPAHRGQYIAFTPEQWEQVKYAVEHLFASAYVTPDGWEEMRDVQSVWPN